MAGKHRTPARVRCDRDRAAAAARKRGWKTAPWPGGCTTRRSGLHGVLGAAGGVLPRGRGLGGRRRCLCAPCRPGARRGRSGAPARDGRRPPVAAAREAGRGGRARSRPETAVVAPGARRGGGGPQTMTTITNRCPPRAEGAVHSRHQTRRAMRLPPARSSREATNRLRGEPDDARAREAVTVQKSSSAKTTT